MLNILMHGNAYFVQKNAYQRAYLTNFDVRVYRHIYDFVFMILHIFNV